MVPTPAQAKPKRSLGVTVKMWVARAAVVCLVPAAIPLGVVFLSYLVWKKKCGDAQLRVLMAQRGVPLSEKVN